MDVDELRRHLARIKGVVDESARILQSAVAELQRERKLTYRGERDAIRKAREYLQAHAEEAR